MSELLHVACLKRFPSGLSGTHKACLCISLPFSGWSYSRQPAEEPPAPCVQLNMSQFLSRPLSHYSASAGHESYYQRDPQIPVTCRCCLNILHQNLPSCQLTEGKTSQPAFQLQVIHKPSLFPLFFPLCINITHSFL